LREAFGLRALQRRFFFWNAPSAFFVVTHIRYSSFLKSVFIRAHPWLVFLQ